MLRESRKWKKPCGAAPERVPAFSHLQRSCVCICIATIYEKKSISRCAYISDVFWNQDWDANDREKTLEGGNDRFGVLQLGRKERDENFD